MKEKHIKPHFGPKHIFLPLQAPLQPRRILGSIESPSSTRHLKARTANCDLHNLSLMTFGVAVGVAGILVHPTHRFQASPGCRACPVTFDDTTQADFHLSLDSEIA